MVSNSCVCSMVTHPTNKFGRRGNAKNIKPHPKLRDPKDKRSDERRKGFKNGRIILSGDESVSCITYNVSLSGCRISAVGAENFPDELVVQVDFLAKPRKARVAWRIQGEAGLEFLKDGGSDSGQQD